MIYNIFVCFVIGFISLVVFLFLLTAKKKNNKEPIKFISCFCLLFSLVWISTGLGVLFVLLDRPDLDAFVFKWFSGPLIYLHLLPVFYYFGWSFFKDKNKIRFLFNGIFTFIVLITVVTFFIYKFTASEITYWGSTLVPNKLTNDIFTYAIFVPTFIFIVAELVRRFRNWKKTGDDNERQLLGFNLGLFIYALTGFFDAISSAQGWLMMLARIGSILPSTVFYLSATWGSEE